MKRDDIKHIGIIGTGMIGASLAVLFTGNGYKTTMYAINDPVSGKNRFDTYFVDLKDKGLVTDGQVKACAKLLNITQRYEDITNVDIIFECVVERLEIKHAIYAQLEKYCKQVRVIASTTSAIAADDLVKGLDVLKDRLLVAHPWNPPHLVPFVEVLKSQYTSDYALEVLLSVLKSVGRKVAVMKRSMPGFIANRLQHALYREAVYMVEQGITTPQDIDLALKYSFMPRYTSIGLFEHFDYAGLDMIVSIEDYLFPTLCSDTKTQELVRNKFNEGKLGYKTGEGVLDWSGVDIDAFRKRASAPYLQFLNWSLPEE